jgi:arylsulfatase A-like enzyme
VAFSRDADRLNVIPAYMGLVKQIDDYLGQLFAFMKERGLWDDTLIVFTADHGDYLGDHWLGEKEFMYEQGVRVPMLIADPSAPQTHGTASQALVEAVDIVPTFLETMGQPLPTHWLEGKSLRPLLEGRETGVREVAVSELDYAIYGAARELGLAPHQARMVMARSDRFKYIHYDGLPPQLFDLQEDPLEFNDLGSDPGYAAVREQHLGWIFDWMRSRRNRVTISDEAIMKRATPAAAGGVIIGEW